MNDYKLIIEYDEMKFNGERQELYLNGKLADVILPEEDVDDHSRDVIYKKVDHRFDAFKRFDGKTFEHNLA